MKKHLILFLCLIMCLGMLSSCGSEPGMTITQTGNSTNIVINGGPGGSNISISMDPGFKETVCQEQSFSTMARSDYPTKWQDGNGLYIGVDGDTSIPYVLIFREKGLSVAPYDILERHTIPEMRQQYGSDMIAVGDIRDYEYGGMPMKGVLFIYKVGEYKVEALRLYASVGSDVFSFIVKYISGEDDTEVFEALETAARYLKVDGAAAGGTGSGGSGGNGSSTENSGSGSGTGFGGTQNIAGVKITQNVTKSISYDDFDNGLFSMKIPHGWKVRVHPLTDYIHYTFMVENPDDPSYRIYFNMKTEGNLQTEAQRKWYASLYPDTPFAILPALEPATTERFYSVFNESMAGYDTGDFRFPRINNFTVVDSVCYNALGGEIVRATYTDENGKTIDGIFNVSLLPVSLYYVVAFNVYDTMFFTVPEGQLTEWAPILDYCLSTLKFSQKFVNGFNDEEFGLMSTIKANAAIYDEISDMIMDSWEKRNASYDIISQKRSDATMGYERVYDTQTGDIYKAYNGFTDDYKGERYKPVTDDMYRDPTSGYIERK